ncbi:MAG: TlpA family protein disulfide reductase [Chitinophagaceae bacterium]|nr:TlpA family protein disulfide reductase [Chitinophagaceae bacterium]
MKDREKIPLFRSAADCNLLMTFSASWCIRCKYEYPFLLEAYKKYASKGLKVIIMNVDDSKDKWAGDVEKYKFPFPVLSDLKAFSGDLTKNYGAMSIPKVFLIAPEGTIVSGTIRQEKILEELEKVYSSK